MKNTSPATAGNLPDSRQLSKAALSASLLTASAGLAVGATTTVGNLENLGLVHGTVVNTQLVAGGITSVTTDSGFGVSAWDTNTTQGNAADDNDILFDDRIVTPGWRAGNLPATTDLGVVLIIQENNSMGTLSDGTTGFSDPDDNAGGGTLTLNLDVGESFRFFEVTLIDTDQDDTLDIYQVRLNGANGETALLNLLEEVADPTSPLYRNNTVGDANFNGLAPIEIGEGALNTYGVIDIADFLPNFNTNPTVLSSVEYIVNGESSGAGRFTFSDTPITPIPEPSSALLALIGSLALLRRSR